MAAKKINLLKDMDIDEISLVVAPMCPGADILFTKGRPADWRAAIAGDVAVEKAARSVSGEARDKRGRWTSAAIAAIGGKQGSYRRQIAQTFADKARAIAHATVAHTVSAVKSTKPVGAQPVRGGGVQFGFEHRLAASADGTPGARVTTHVQIRPEHLGSVEEGKPKNKAQLALHTLHRMVKTVNNQEAEPFSGSERLSFMRASVHPGDLARAATSLFTGGSSSPAPAPTSTSAPSGGLGWLPPAMKAPWVQDAQALRPVGHGRKTDPSDAEAPQIPLRGHTARTAGGWPYYTPQGDFIPGGRPDVQEHMEKVHQELARMPAEQRAGYIKNRTQSAYANITENKGYFTQHGDYIPPSTGDQGNLRVARERMEDRYNKERERLKSGPASATPASTTPAARLFGPETPGGGREQEYDLGSQEQRAAARDAFRSDVTRKSLFPVPPGTPITVLPPGPHRPSLFWHLDTGPVFTSREAGEPVAKRRKSLNFDA